MLTQGRVSNAAEEGLGGDEAVREARLVRRYYTRQGPLHGHCFYIDLCDHLEETEHPDSRLNLNPSN